LEGVRNVEGRSEEVVREVCERGVKEVGKERGRSE